MASTTQSKTSSSGFFKASRKISQTDPPKEPEVQSHIQCLLDQQAKVVQEEILKRAQRQENIERLLGKTKKRLKLNQMDHGERFNNRFFKEIRSLQTFVDAQNQLKRLNIFNNQHLLNQIQFIKDSKDKYSMDDNKVLEQLVADDLLLELSQVNSNNQYGNTLQSLKNVGQLLEILPNESKQGTQINFQKYFKSRTLLTQSEAISRSIYVQSHRDSLVGQQVDNEPNKLQNSQSQFYNIINSKMKEIHSLKRPIEKQNQQNPFQNKKDMITNIISILQGHGIDINQDYQSLKGEIHEKYKQNSDKVVTNIKATAKAKYKKFEERAMEESKAIKSMFTTPERIKFEKEMFRRQIRAHTKYGKVKPLILKSTATTLQPLLIQTMPTSVKSNNQPLIRLIEVENNLVPTKLELLSPRLKDIIKSPTFLTQSQSPRQRRFISKEQTNVSQFKKMNKNLTDLISKIEQVAEEFSIQKEEDCNQLKELNSDMENMQQKYEQNKKLQSLGFSQSNHQLNLKHQLRQTIKNAAKSIRTIKIIKYY